MKTMVTSKPRSIKSMRKQSIQYSSLNIARWKKKKKIFQKKAKTAKIKSNHSQTKKT